MTRECTIVCINDIGEVKETYGDEENIQELKDAQIIGVSELDKNKACLRCKARCSFLSKASDSDSKALCLALDSLSHSFLTLAVPSGSNSLLHFIAILLLSRLVAMELRLRNE